MAPPTNARLLAMYCQDCERQFSNPVNYQRHIASSRCERNRQGARGGGRLRGGRFVCYECPSQHVFTTPGSLLRHVRRYHKSTDSVVYRCGVCSLCFDSKEKVQRHRRLTHVWHTGFQLIESAHRRECQLLRAFFPEHVRSLDEGLIWGYNRMKRLVHTLASEYSFFKINFTFMVEMHRLDEFGYTQEVNAFPFRGLGLTVGRETGEIKEELHRILGDIDRNVGEFLFQGSGWIVSRPLFIDGDFSRCRPLAGGANLCTHSAKWVRQGGIQYSNTDAADDGKCFYRGVANAILDNYYPTAESSETDVERFVNSQLTLLPKRSQVAVKDIPAFEEANKRFDLAVNVVYQDEEGLILPVYASKNLSAKITCVLMLFHTSVRGPDGVEEGTIGHFAYVKHPATLFAHRSPDKSGRTRVEPIYICWNCFSTHYRKQTYDTHISYCHEVNSQRVKYPRPGEVLSFESVQKSKFKQTQSAYTLYFDFESLQVEPTRVCSCDADVMEHTKEVQREKEEWEQMTQEDREDFLAEQVMLEGELTEEWQAKVDEYREGTRKRAPPASPAPMPKRRRRKVCTHKTHVLKEQPPFAFACVLIDREGVVHEERSYVGDDADEQFIRTVLALADKYLPSLTPGADMTLTEEDEQMAKMSTHCYLCQKELTEEQRGVRDHDHLTGRFLGVAHSLCNLRRRENVQLTCMCHNFSGYDSHFLVRALGKFRGQLKSIDSIPLNSQKFKMITINDRIKFVDSYAFMPSSLSALVDTACKSDCKFPVLEQLTQDAGEKKALLRKGVYPYSLATSIDALRNMTAIPPIEGFYNDLSEKECSQEDYDFACEMWERFDCQDMVEYTTLYMKTDVYLLADVMHQFRQQVWSSFKLDLCNYLSLPHISLDIMLKETEAEIQLIDDQEMSNVLKQNIRGGHAYAGLRHCKADDDVCMAYVDVNNLYGSAMRQPLPISDYRWMTEEEVAAFDVERDLEEEEGTHGYILEVDLAYPKELHLAHNAFPLAPHNMEIVDDDLSPYSKACKEAIGMKAKHKARKLTATFQDREKYLVHGRNLKYYLSKGLKLLKVHRIITFVQDTFIRPFIDMCSQKRMNAKTVAEADLYKLLANSLYGKFIESIHKRMDARFNRSGERAIRNASSPLYKGSMVCGENLSITFHQKPQVMVKQSWMVGFAILELSKLTMAKLYYDDVQPSLGLSNVSVVMSDTDSFLLAVRNHTEDEVMDKLAHVMDFSNYAPTHRLYSVDRKKKPGYLKNEMPHTKILEAVALKAKSYALQTSEGVKATAKGVAGAVRSKLNFDAFHKCFSGLVAHRVNQNTISSKNHINRMLRSNKVAFSSFDDKRFLMCQKHSAPYGSYLIDDFKKSGGVCFFCAHPNSFY